MTDVPPTLHLTVCRSGGGTEATVRRLVDSEAAFHRTSLEELGAWSSQDGLKLLHAARELRLREERVVFCYGAQAHLAALAAWPRIGPALVGNVRGEIDFARLKALIPKLGGRRFSFWVANCRMVLGSLPGRVIMTGVPAPPPDEKPLFPNLPRPVFGLIANERPLKGHRFFLRRWVELGRPGSVVFAGRLGPELQATAGRFGVHFPGYVEAGPVLRSLDLLVVPSRTESVPAVILEAMRRGVPALATPVGGIPEVIDHRRTGFLVPRDGWLEFLRRLDPADLPAVGENARREAGRHFTLERMAEEFRQAARDAAAKD